MRKEKLSMEEAFRTLPELPKDFIKWCHSFLPEIPIYYKREGKIAKCQCGKCGEHYIVEDHPSRNEKAECPHCKNKGFYEWKRIVRAEFFGKGLFIVQRTTSNDLAVRYFGVYQDYRQGREARIELTEEKRIFLTLGDVYKYSNNAVWDMRKGKYEREWQETRGFIPMKDGELYRGWKEELKKSSLKYCDVNMIKTMTRLGIINVMIAFANNPAIEMYAKAGMEELVRWLIRKEGKTKQINRRGKSLKGQLRLKDGQKIKRFIAEKGNLTFLEILQTEEKMKENYTIEQETFLKEMFQGYGNKKAKIMYLTKYMTLQQLINRVKKYDNQPGYYGKLSIVDGYYDYLKMREELGYDMTNEVFLYPKNLRQKHDEMVREKNERADELHIAKKMKQFPNIAKKYEKLCKKYNFKKDGYVIRPAKDAGEIIMEGRTLHHCVGGDLYLRKHNEGKTVILFLRKEKSPQKPYYTIEIKENEILQWYGINDSRPNKGVIGPWLDCYMEKLKHGKRNKLKEAG